MAPGWRLHGATSSYGSVRRYAARWLLETKTQPGDGGLAFVPLMFAPGEAFQFDFSHQDAARETGMTRA